MWAASHVRLHFPESSKRRMEELVANLIDAYRVSITNSDWLGEDTKAKALEKISKFTPKIGYTNHWRDYSALSVSADALPAENAKAAKPVRRPAISWPRSASRSTRTNG